MKAIRTSIIIAVILLTSIVSTSHSQTDETRVSPVQNSLQEDAWALQFRIDRDFTLSSFQGAIISVKHHLSREQALRLGVSVHFNSSDNTGLSLTQADSIRYGMSSSGDNNAILIDLRVQYLYYCNPDGEVNLFLGAGPLLNFSRSASERSEATIPSAGTPSSSVRTDRSHSWALGLSGLAGVEWFASKRFSLHAEYGVALQHVWANSESESTATQIGLSYSVHSNSEYKEKGWQFYYQAVNFGLSVYF